MAQYKLSDIEEKAEQKFNKKHYKKCGSGMSVIFTDTGIGLKVQVQCNKCNKIKDITDHSCW